jgi:hypothetical protein
MKLALATSQRVVHPFQRLVVEPQAASSSANLLYIGVTRGKRLVVLVGQKKAIAIAVRNISGRRRLVETGQVAASRAARCTANRHDEVSHGSRKFEVSRQRLVEVRF